MSPPIAGAPGATALPVSTSTSLSTCSASLASFTASRAACCAATPPRRTPRRWPGSLSRSPRWPGSRQSGPARAERGLAPARPGPSLPAQVGVTMPEGRGSLDERMRRSLRQIGPLRLAVTLVVLGLAIWLARFAWQIDLASDAERALYDLRFTARAERTLSQDERITLVTYNDDTLAELGKRSPLDRALLARALREIDAMHPRGIGIDILIDQAQPEDDELLATFRSLRTPAFLAFASARHNPDQMLPWQERFLRGFI